MNPYLLAIMFGGSLLTNWLGANNAANASKDAAKTQSDAARYAANLAFLAGNQSLQYQRDVFQRQQENAAPWLAVGKGALSKLSYLSGVVPQDSPPMQFTADPMGGNPLAYLNAPATAVPRPGTTPNPTPTPHADNPHGARPVLSTIPGNAPLPVASPQSSPSMNASAYVPLQAPDGSIENVPAELVEHYLARGARRLQ